MRERWSRAYACGEYGVPPCEGSRQEALDGRPAAVTEVGESRTCIRVAGPRARDLLAKGSPLDVHPRVFAAGACAQGQLAKATVLIHQVDDAPAYDV
jgi:sarcosine oxidase subunit gamma